MSPLIKIICNQWLSTKHACFSTDAENHPLTAFPCTGNRRKFPHYFFFFLPVSTLIWAQNVKPKGQDLVSMNKKLRAGGEAGQAVCSLQGVTQLRE